MRRHLVTSTFGRDEDANFHKFQGTVHVVDLSTINRRTEEFDGRDWLVHRTNEGLPLGWDLEWQPDRSKEQDNPVALMQFADDTTALLIRTHRTRGWLPQAVVKALKSESCAKVGVGYDGNDKMKMQNTFNLQPSNVRDLAVVAKKKGLAEQGLKALCEHFGFKPKKDSRCARSDWAIAQLSLAQVQYAADDAYFPFMIDHLLDALPDAKESPDDNLVDKGILRMKEGWAEEGIVRKHDGLYCTTCGQGPMTVPETVQSHLGSKKHMKKMEIIRGAAAMPELPESWAQQGIVLGDTMNGTQVEYRCTICETTMTSRVAAEQHVGSNKHKKMTGAPGAAERKDVRPNDPFEDGLWNMPDYVSVEDTRLVCTLCNSQAASCLLMGRHLGGATHAKKCRSHMCEEIHFEQTRKRVEFLATGLPVVRTGFKAPRNNKDTPTSGTCKHPTKLTLRDGWREATDKASGKSYYYNLETGQSTWDFREAAVEESARGREDTESEAEGEDLPEGWFETVDAKTGEAYYYTEEGNVQWERPRPLRRKKAALPVSRTQTLASDASVSGARPRTQASQQLLQPQPRSAKQAIADASQARTVVLTEPQPAASATSASRVTPPKRRLPPGWHVIELPNRCYYYGDYHGQVSSIEAPEPCLDDWRREVDSNGKAYWCRSSPSDLWFYEDNPHWERVIDVDGAVFWATNHHGGVRFFEINGKDTSLRDGAAVGA